MALTTIPPRTDGSGKRPPCATLAPDPYRRPLFALDVRRQRRCPGLWLEYPVIFRTGNVLYVQPARRSSVQNPDQGYAPIPRYASQVPVMSKSKASQATVRIEMRCTEDDASLIRAKALAAGITTSDLLRRSALSRKIVTRTDTKLMGELLRLGGLQKHLYNQMQEGMTTELSRQFSEVLVEVKKAIIALDLDQVPVTR